MDEIVPSKMALETEIMRWKNLRQTLANEEEKQAFDEVMDMCRNNGMTAASLSIQSCLSPWSLAFF